MESRDGAGGGGGGGGHMEEPPTVRMTNADFRKLLMTPRPASSSSAAAAHSKDPHIHSATPARESENKSELRRKKKSFYAALKKQEDNKLAELAEKYRDRARERRDGVNQDYAEDDPSAGAGSAYRAVAPDLKSGMDAKERRRQMIQKSKFLGGDMEHTHLVKGLDYALLQKVRAEIHSREVEQEQQMEQLADGLAAEKEIAAEKEEQEDELEFKTDLGKNIIKTLTMLKSKTVERNEMFIPGRMAYVIDLEEEGDTDIPTTLMRSRADLPTVESDLQTLTTNDIVINKLAQILSYLRQGGKHLKKTKKNKQERIVDKPEKVAKPPDDSIYGDIGDYAPTKESSSKNREKDFRDGRDRHRDEDKKKAYFDKPLEKEEEIVIPGAKVKAASLLSKLAAEPEGYAECYPGLREMDDAIDDSDDEVDYSKMDLGNKKGPIGRWDFDTQEEYSAYMNQKEALPKAAFQYGVKTMDGRKTRKTNKDKSDKAEFDREWQQIQNIIQKRKAPKETGGGEPEFKVPKY